MGRLVPARARRAQAGDVHSAPGVRQTVAVAVEFLAIGEPVVRGEDRLGPLQVRVTGKNAIEIGVTASDKGLLHVGQPGVDSVDRVANPQPHVGGDLIVPAPTGVQLSADIPDFLDQGLFDVHVDIFEFDPVFEPARLDLAADFLQSAFDPVPFVVGKQAHLGQHPAWALEPSISCA